MKLLLVIAITVLPLFSESIEVEVKGLNGSKGVVQVSLFNQAKGFPSDYTKACKVRTLSLDKSIPSVLFDSLPQGRYAVAAIHDEDSNKKLKAGLFGQPQEGWGVSKNVNPQFRAPKFNEASFQLSGDTLVEIELLY